MNEAWKKAPLQRILRAIAFAAVCALSISIRISAQIAPAAASGPDSQSIAASPAADSAPQETVQLFARGSFQTEKASVGDTVVYRLLVEWHDTRVPVVVLAPDSLQTSGFRVVEQSATHRKTAENGAVRNATEFLYKLLATEPGGAKVDALKLRYLTGFSNREEGLYVPAAFIEIAPIHIPIWKRLWFEILYSIALAAVLGWGIRRAYRSEKEKRKQAQAVKTSGFAPEVFALKGRWNTADSRVWIADAEKICMDFLRRRLGKQAPETARFEALLDPYLALNPALDIKEAEGWNKLRELFHHARYAGGRREVHELQETYRILKTCLHIQGENE